MDIISPRSRTEIDAARIIVPLNERYSEVRNDRGQKQYTIYGVNVHRAGQLIPASADATLVVGDYQKEIRDSEIPVKIGDGTWHTEIGGYRLRCKSLVGFDTIDSRLFTRTPIEKYRTGSLGIDNTLTAFGEFGTVKFIPEAARFKVRHRISSKIHTRAGKKFYGTVWEFDNPLVLDLLKADEDNLCKFFVDGNQFVEYFPGNEFYLPPEDPDDDYYTQKQASMFDWYEHDYTTVGGNLTADTTWAAGTWYISGSWVTTNGFNLTFDCADGNVVVKTDGQAIQDTAGDTIRTINSTSSNKLICTSENDDSRGEAIIGSSGTPAKGDQSAYWLLSYENGGVVDLNYAEFRYCDPGNLPVCRHGINADRTTDITYKHTIWRDCGVGGGGVYHHAICGLYRYTGNGIQSVTLEDCSIDTSCDLGGGTRGRGIFFGITGVAQVRRLYVKPDNAVAGVQAIALTIRNGGTSHVLENSYCAVNSASNSAVNLAAVNTPATITVNNLIVTNSAVSGTSGLRCAGSGTTLTANVSNSIALDCNGTTTVGFFDGGSCLSTLNNCGDFNCTTRDNFDTDNNPITNKDPNEGNLPGDVTIDADCPFPNGLAVRNLTDYEKAGSDTFDNLDYNETELTATGYAYAGTDSVTPGIMYTLDAFSTASVRLTNANGDFISFSMPKFSYTVTIALPLDIQSREDGKFGIFDHGSSYDKRWCDCMVELSSSESGTLLDFLRTEGASDGRSKDLTLDGVTGNGFEPFGPDKGPTGPFTVAVVVMKQEGIGPRPFKYFKIHLRIYNVSTYPAYSLPTEVSDGSFQFGTVTNLRMPTNWFDPTNRYGYFTTQLEDGSVEYIDRGANADYYRTLMQMTQNESKSAALLDYLTGTARGTNFNIVSVADMNPFGKDLGDGTITVNLIDNSIQLTHVTYNQWMFGIPVSRISGP